MLYQNVVKNYRGVAQSGSAPQWGCGGRRFESSRPDHVRVHFFTKLYLFSKVLSLIDDIYPNAMLYGF